MEYNLFINRHTAGKRAAPAGERARERKISAV